MWVLLKGGRIIDPSCEFDSVGDVLIKDDRISAVGHADTTHLDPSEGTVYDCTGLVVTPGLVDMHVHLREPGFEHKETIDSGARAAAAGGFTSVLAMPNTMPAVDNRAVVEYVLHAGRNAVVNVLTTCAATKNNEGKEIAEIGDMIDAGATAVSDDAFPVQNANTMRRVMEYCRTFDTPVLTHCEDRALTVDAVMNEGVTSTMLGLRPWPRQAEETMILRNLLLAELTRCKLHIQHVTTIGGVEAIRWAKSRGISVTCETCPQYFSLTDQALMNYDTNAKCCPPLRTDADVEAIKHGLADGTIDAIATDHAPHAAEDKEVELAYAAFGMVGLETALPLVISNLVEPGVLTLPEAVAKMTIGPARVLGVEAGTLKAGTKADITIIDPASEVTVRKDQLRSKGRNTPFEGFELRGRAVATMVGGTLVHGESALTPADEKTGVRNG